MLTGIQALGHIDDSLRSAKNEIHRIDNELAQLTALLTENRQQQSKTLSQIARIRLSSISDGSLLDRLNSADQEAISILEQRKKDFDALEVSIRSETQLQDQLERERNKLLLEANKLSKALAKKEAKIQTNLSKDETYLIALQQAEKTDAIADEAERKAQDSAESLEEKGKPYQADDLFMYLWKRRYGTTEYKNYKPINRLLDGWVAKKIKYSNSRANYWNIQEIPKRLLQHAEAVRDESENSIIQVQQLEQQALESGGAHQIRADLDIMHDKINLQDELIASKEDEMNQLLQTRVAFSSGEDPSMLRCLNILTSAMQHQSVMGLRQIVNATRSTDDDFMLDELKQYQSRQEEIQDDINQLRTAHNTKLSRLRELEEVRRNFKRHRFDDTRSGFGNDALIGSILGQFLQGVVSGTDVWRVLQRNQRHRDVGAWPDFGSGHLGRGSSLGDILGDLSRPRRRSRGGISDIFGTPAPRRRAKTSRRSSWHWPNSNNGGFRLPSGRRSGGGGFKTGGGF